MANRETAFIEITPEVLLKAYACGIFPMAESAEDPALYWIEPEMGGILPLDRFPGPARRGGGCARRARPPGSPGRGGRGGGGGGSRYTVTVNRDIDAVLDGCAEPRT